MVGVDQADARTAGCRAEHSADLHGMFLDRNGLKGARLGVFRQTLKLLDGADERVTALFEKALVDLRAAGAEIVDDFTVPGFETFPRPPQTPARTKADWEAFFAYEGQTFPVKTVAELRDAPPAKRVHPLHTARVAEIAAVTSSPEQDPATVQGRKDEQMYRDKLGAAMESAHVAALVFPVWTFPPKINGDRGQTPQGSLTFIGSATQWPVVVVPWASSARICQLAFKFWVGPGPRHSSSSLPTLMNKPHTPAAATERAPARRRRPEPRWTVAIVRRRCRSPNGITRLRHSCLIERTNRSA